MCTIPVAYTYAYHCSYQCLRVYHGWGKHPVLGFLGDLKVVVVGEQLILYRSPHSHFRQIVSTSWSDLSAVLSGFDGVAFMNIGGIR